MIMHFGLIGNIYNFAEDHHCCPVKVPDDYYKV